MTRIPSLLVLFSLWERARSLDGKKANKDLELSAQKPFVGFLRVKKAFRSQLHSNNADAVCFIGSRPGERSPAWTEKMHSQCRSVGNSEMPLSGIRGSEWAVVAIPLRDKG